MIARIGAALNRVASKVVPEPFVLALALTLLVMAIGAVAVSAGIVLPDGATGNVWSGWFAGFTSQGGMAFALQMCLILVTGHALALSPPMRLAVDKLALLPRNAAQASAIVALVACLAGLAHWGLGAIAGALLARELGQSMARRGVKVHYPLLGAAAYAGLAVWHGGLSGSAPLKSAEEGSFTEAFTNGPLALSDTLLSPLNIAVMGTLIIAIPALCYFLTPASEDDFIPAPALPADRDETIPAAVPATAPDAVPQLQPGWLERFQSSPVLGAALGGASAVAIIAMLVVGRLSLDMNTVILLFLFAAIALQGSLTRFVAAIADGARGAGAIIVQFPFYFGILGVMKETGLIELISQGLVQMSSTATFPVFAFLSSGIVNLVVPSGGGQWAVQAEILLTAGNALNVDPAATVMAFSYGDAWTNMLQPFWALPLLGIMGLKAKDIIGYTAMIFLLMLVVVPLWLMILCS